MLAAHEYRVFDDDDFGAYFRLNAETGEDVWLISADAAGKLTAFVEHVEFGAVANGESLGRWPDVTGDLYPLKNRTLGEPNDIAGNGPRIGPLLISEVMYKPSVSAGQNPDDYEYIEIFNPTNAAVALDNWHLADGVSYDFAAGTSIAAHGTLVVLPFNPADPLNATKLANFKAKYGVGASVQLVGGFAGHLDDGGETVQLQRPDAMVPGSVPPLYPALLEDEINYDEASPWPQGANGGGSSLQRLGLNTWGHDPASWTADQPTPGAIYMDMVVSSSPSTAGPTNADSLTFTVVFSASVVNVSSDDFLLTSTGTAAGTIVGVTPSSRHKFHRDGRLDRRRRNLAIGPEERHERSGHPGEHGVWLHGGQHGVDRQHGSHGEHRRRHSQPATEPGRFDRDPIQRAGCRLRPRRPAIHARRRQPAIERGDAHDERSAKLDSRQPFRHDLCQSATTNSRWRRRGRASPTWPGTH